MNIEQARAVVELLRTAEHPRLDAYGREYTTDEYAEFTRPSAHVERYHGQSADDHHPEMMEIDLATGGRSVRDELYVDPSGGVWSWSTIQIPPEDLDCECPGPPESKVDRSSCPVHGDSTRELDVFRRASIKWGVVAREFPPSPPTWSWRLRVEIGDPIYDVLAEYRAERFKAKAEAFLAQPKSAMPGPLRPETIDKFMDGRS